MEKKQDIPILTHTFIHTTHSHTYTFKKTSQWGWEMEQERKRKSLPLWPVFMVCTFQMTVTKAQEVVTGQKTFDKFNEFPFEGENKANVIKRERENERERKRMFKWKSCDAFAMAKLHLQSKSSQRH